MTANTDNSKVRETSTSRSSVERIEKQAALLDQLRPLIGKRVETITAAEQGRVYIRASGLGGTVVVKFALDEVESRRSSVRPGGVT